jgi:hypothetical protein
MVADALGRNAMPDLKQLQLAYCGIQDDGFVALASGFGAEHWFAKSQRKEMILIASFMRWRKPPNIKDCSKLTLWRMGIFTRRYRCWRLSKEHQPGEEVDILIYGL